MPRNLLHQGEEWLWDQIDENVAEEVQVVQGETVYSLYVTPAYEESSSDDSMGIIYNDRQQDFLISKEKMNELGMRDFARGDKVIRKIEKRDPPEGLNPGYDTVTYDAVSDGSEPVWRYCSRARLRVRLHTKRIDYEYMPPIRPTPPPV